MKYIFAALIAIAMAPAALPMPYKSPIMCTRKMGDKYHCICTLEHMKLKAGDPLPSCCLAAGNPKMSCNCVHESI